MPGISTTDAVHSLQEAMASLPSDLDARSEFFIQWRARTIQMLEAAFADDPDPARQFKDLEFSPRLLGKNESRDSQLKLDAFLAGCATARALLEELLRRLMTPAPDATLAPDASPAPDATPAPTVQLSQPKQQPESPKDDLIEVHVEPGSSIVNPYPQDIIKGATMDSRELCVPVRSSLARVLGAWDRGDKNMALMLSAQLLADLKVLSHSDPFKAAFEDVMTNAMESGIAPPALDALKSAAPLCVWSMVAAMNEVMK